MAIAKSPYRTLDWRRPSGVSFPRLIEQGLARLKDARERPSSPIAKAMASAVPVFRPDGQARQRRLRSDGVANLVALLCASMATADLKGGLIATPVADGGGWDRKTWAELDFRAFGPEVPDERSLRRTERHARSALAAGWLRIVPWKMVAEDGQWRSLPGLKFVTDKLWRLLGLYDQVKAARRERDRQKGRDRLAQVAGLDTARAPGRRQHRAPQEAAGATPARAASPPGQAPPERQRAAPETAAEHIERIKKMLRV